MVAADRIRTQNLLPSKGLLSGGVVGKWEERWKNKDLTLVLSC